MAVRFGPPDALRGLHHPAAAAPPGCRLGGSASDGLLIGAGWIDGAADRFGNSGGDAIVSRPIGGGGGRRIVIEGRATAGRCIMGTGGRCVDICGRLIGGAGGRCIDIDGRLSDGRCMSAAGGRVASGDPMRIDGEVPPIDGSWIAGTRLIVGLGA